MNRLALIVVASISAVLLASCGSSSSSSKTLPKAQFIARADTICAKELKTVSAPAPNFNPATASTAQIKSVAPFLRQQATAIHNGVTEIAGLGKPDQDQALLERLLADGRLSAVELSAAADAAAKGDKQGVQAAISKSPDDNALAKRFGFKVCARSSG